MIDCDQHLYESRTTWADHIDPAHVEDALAITDDDLGYAWLTWRGERIAIADVQRPGRTAEIGEHRRRRAAGEPADHSYDEALPADYWDPAARVERIREMGFDEALLFPNYGLAWERRLSRDLPALTANMAAWNRWTISVAAEGQGRLHPVAHLTLRDADWIDQQLRVLAEGGVRLAMIAPALVDGRPLSHPDHDRLWAAFVEHGVTPVFHVADQPRVFDDAWYTDADETFIPVIESVFLWTPPALALTDLILNGTFERHPGLRIGVIELSAVWVPMYLMMLDGAEQFTTRQNGQPLAPLSQKPSDYFKEHVRVAAFSYELPARLTRQAGDLFMACSDYPHSEGTAQPVQDYENAGCAPGEDTAGLFVDNCRVLLGPERPAVRADRRR